MKWNQILWAALAALTILCGCARGAEQGTPVPAGTQPAAAATPAATTAPVTDPTPTPSPVPTLSPTPTPSPVPTLSPSPVPTPSPTPLPIGEIAVDWDALAALDASKDGWGPGYGNPPGARPEAAVRAQEALGDLGALFLMPDEPVLYLTFDEGYENGCTPQILDTLGEKDVKATFFVTMGYVKENPELVRRMIDEGHVLGNHSFSHPSLPDVALDEARNEIVLLHEYVRDHFQVEMSLFRPPMGEYSARTLGLAQQLGYRSAFWSFAYRDWEPAEQLGPEAAFQKVTENVHPGAIYLLHAVSSDNAAILGDLIDAVRAKGYDILPLT